MENDEFLKAYLACALWASTDDIGDPMDLRHDMEDLSPEFLAEAKEDCDKFQKENAQDIKINLSRAGHDFWLTRNGEGAGFWDGDWPKEAGDRLTEAAHKFGPCHLYTGDDGMVYAG